MLLTTDSYSPRSDMHVTTSSIYCQCEMVASRYTSGPPCSLRLSTWHIRRGCLSCISSSCRKKSKEETLVLPATTQWEDMSKTVTPFLEVRSDRMGYNKCSLECGKLSKLLRCVSSQTLKWVCRKTGVSVPKLFKICQDKALNKLVWMTFLCISWWTRQAPEVPFKLLLCS